MNVYDLVGRQIGFAASGGLDSCTITHWLKSKGVEVICFTADLGQPDEDDFSNIERRMTAAGASKFVAVPLKKEMAEVGLAVVQAQAAYEDRYWNVTGAARVVITHGIAARLKDYGIDTLSHGATGRGNDQVRFQIIASMLNPELRFYAPWRDDSFLREFRGRKAMIDYCQQHDIPIKASQSKPYSTDANLLGLTHEGGALEALDTPMQFVTPGMGVWPGDAPNTPERLSLRFEHGRPVELNGVRIELVELFEQLNRLGGSHGVGIATHLVENRFVGVKSRGVYEAPAMEILGTSYRFLLQLVLDQRARSLFETLSRYLSVQLYQGYWDDLGSRMARRSIATVSQLVTGSIEVELHKGHISYVSAKHAPHSLYSNAGSMEDEGDFDHRDAEGLLNILTLGARISARARQTSLSAEVEGSHSAE